MISTLVFNKTVGLRDTLGKKEPKQPPTSSNQVTSTVKRKPIDVIKQLGKKYTNLPEEKQQKVKAGDSVTREGGFFRRFRAPI